MKHNKTATHHLHGIRVLLLGVLVAAALVVQLDTPTLTAPSDKSPSSGVLAYATNVNHADLLSQTNHYRTQNNLPPLKISSSLNISAQNKAQHMIANNYWAHVAPDGTQPWYFFNQAGYNYLSAGENLAYGFSSSTTTVGAWMNSATHRANILGDYTEVGFGIANGASYQNGQNTVIVAHYGTRQASTPPLQSEPEPTSTVATTNTPPQTTDQPEVAQKPDTATKTPESTEKTPPTQEDDKDIVISQEDETAIPVAAGVASGSINILESIRLGSLPSMAAVGILLTFVATAGFILTHRSLVRHAVASGERFAIRHPLMDISALVLIAAIILTTSISRIG